MSGRTIRVSCWETERGRSVLRIRGFSAGEGAEARALAGAWLSLLPLLLPEAGSVAADPEILIECDRCGLSVPMPDAGAPDGWTESERDGGFVHACPACSGLGLH